MKKNSISYASCISVIFLSLLYLDLSGQLVPVPLTTASLNHDLIAEGSGNDPEAVTTISIGGHAALYDASFRAANPVITDGGLPANGIIPNGADIWQLYPYTANNALFFPGQSAITAASTKSLTLSTPGQYSIISLLTFAVNGAVSVNITVYFTDASTTSFGNFTINDGFGGTPFVIQGFGIIDRGPIASQSGTPTEPRMYQLDLPLSMQDQAKSVELVQIIFNDVSNNATVSFFAASGIPLGLAPIKYTSFNGRYQSSGNKILLAWQAENTTNTIGFDVERSSSASAFTTISKLNAEKTVGTSKYNYIDYDIKNSQKLFYRIKETLVNGSANYSRIIEVKTLQSAYFKIILSAGTLRLITAQPEKSFMYRIIDMHGVVLKSGTVSSANQFKIDVYTLPPGVYSISVQNDEKSQTLQFVR